MALLLVLDRDPSVASRCARFFGASGWSVQLADSCEDVAERLAHYAFDAMLLDVAMDCREVLGLTADRNEQSLVVVSATPEEMDSAVEAVRGGAVGILRRPYTMAEAEVELTHLLDYRRLRHEAQDLRSQRDLLYRTDYIVGRSAPIIRCFELANRVAPTDASVLLLGETGTGKELVAGSIHYSSRRSGGAFVKVNCAAIPDALLESELFGHERGAFTGAERLRVGRFELADGGSIFLDEVGDMSLATQAKLLRVLQEKSFERLGGSRTITTDVRVIAATNRDLGTEIERGTFRRDLYYRLAVFTIELPPLRERGSDVELLAEHFLDRLAADMKRPHKALDESARRRLRRYGWPGNVRELRNVIERAVLLSDEPVISGHELDLPNGGTDETGLGTQPGFGIRLPEGGVRLDEVERELVVQALERTGFVQRAAAELLGVSRRVLNYKIRRLGLRHPSWTRNREEESDESSSET